MEIRQVFEDAIRMNASDVFLKEGKDAGVRVTGKVRQLDGYFFASEDAQKLLQDVLDERSKHIFNEKGEVDISYTLEGLGRFRVNVFKQRGNLCFVFRIIKTKIPTLEELRLPAEQLKKLAMLPRGLILVTGIAGSGKSTTLASMIEYVNTNEAKHIITIEDPVEYLFEDKKCMIEQREVGIDTPTFASALRHVLRQSPDIIMIGEMRDLETMDTALQAAETGHLVLSTLHTVNAMQTVERILNLYPPHMHTFVRMQLSLLLEGVVAQRLIPTKDGSGLVPAVELMLATPSIKEALFEGRTKDLYKLLKEGTFFGTQTFNQSLKDWFTADIITLEDALKSCDSPEEFKLEIRGIQKGTKQKDWDFKF